MNKTPKFWIGVACKEHVANGVKLGICQFCHGKSGPAKRLCRGDFVIYYSSKVTMESTELYQKFTAIGEVTDDTTYQVDMGDGFKPFRRNISYFDTKHIDIKPLVPLLPFIKNKNSWGYVFRYGFLEIDQESFEIIANGMLGFNPLLEVDYWQNVLTQSETIKWAIKTLKQTEINMEIVVQTPWSSVVRINTGNELFYLKTTPALIALEAKIIQILHDQFHAPVPTVIAHNTELHCFLMKDAGTSLRSILKKKFDTDLLCKAIEQFTLLQLTVADHVDDFIDIGVPDWRLNKMPDLYRQAILQKDLLMADGLSELEVNELEKLHPKIADLCEKLSGYAIKETIVQPDFNDNNTLIDDQSKAITIIDLGEISISHPFFSLLNCLHVIKKHHALTNEDATYLRIKDACLKNYMQFESEKNVADALEIAHVLWFVYGLLAHDRLMQACGREQLISFQHGKLSEMLKGLIAACKAY